MGRHGGSRKWKSCVFLMLCWLLVRSDKSVVSNQPQVGWSRTDMRSVCVFSVSKSTHRAIRRVTLLKINQFRMKEVELHPSEVTKETTTRVKLGCLSRCDGSAVLMSKLGSCCAGVIGPVEAKEKDQDPIKTICVVNLHPPSGKKSEWRFFILLEVSCSRG